MEKAVWAKKKIKKSLHSNHPDVYPDREKLLVGMQEFKLPGKIQHRKFRQIYYLKADGHNLRLWH